MQKLIFKTEYREMIIESKICIKGLYIEIDDNYQSTLASTYLSRDEIKKLITHLKSVIANDEKEK